MGVLLSFIRHKDWRYPELPVAVAEAVAVHHHLAAALLVQSSASVAEFPGAPSAKGFA